MRASGLRQSNERAVLTVIATTPGSSAAQIARATGLGPQSVSRILTEFETAGLIYRGETLKGQRGQPASPIFMDPNGIYSLGCEIGWRHMHIVVRNLGGQILGEHRRDYDYPDPGTLLPELGSLALLLIGLVPAAHRSRILGIGIAMPSAMARHAHLLGTPEPVAHAWESLDVAAEMAKVTGLEVFKFNDGNAGCWAELAAHPVPRPNNLAYLHVGTFVSAGLIAEGRLWEGPTGNSANLGSMVVLDNSGNREFVHFISSIFAFESQLRAAGKPVPNGNPFDWDWALLEPQASLWLDHASRALANVIVNTSAVMEFGVVVVDGVMPRPVVNRLVDMVRQQVNEYPQFTTENLRIEMGRLGGQAPARGAALRPIFRKMFSRDTADLLE
jgi:predicted NBD/HSP70 family sugar kinase